MLKSLSILIALFIGSNIVNACEYIESKKICNDEKLQIMDSALKDIKYAEQDKLAIKYGIKHSCKEDYSCIQETLAYQLRMNGHTVSNYNISDGASITGCANIYTLYPEHTKVIVHLNKTLSLGSLNDDVFKNDKQIVYLLENLNNNDKNLCINSNKLKLTKIKSVN